MKAKPSIRLLLVLLLCMGNLYGQKRITDAKFAGTDFKEEVDHSRDHFVVLTYFNDAVFGARALFRYTNFDSITYFTSAYFSAGAYFEGVRFHSPVNFYGCQFYGETDFLGADFDASAIFQLTHFDSMTSFSGATFNSFAYFGNAHFYREVFFNATSFKSTASFTEVRFDTGAFFDATVFDTSVLFVRDSFMTKAIFSNAKFGSDVYFYSAYFKDKLSLNSLAVSNSARFEFGNAILPDTIDLSNNPYWFMQLPYTIDFTLCDFPEDAKTKQASKSLWQAIQYNAGLYLYPSDTQYAPGGKHLINLYNTDISKLKIDYAHFRLYLQDEYISNDTNRAISDDVKKSAYEQLLKNFKDRGQMDSYKLLDIEYQRFKNGNQHFDLQDWWWRYGYERWRVFIHALLFIILFSLYNFFRIHKLNEEQYGVYNIELIPEELYTRSENNKGIRWLLRRLWAAVAYTSVLFFLLTLKVDKIRFSKVRASMWILFIYSVGLLCLGYMANFVLQK